MNRKWFIVFLLVIVASLAGCTRAKIEGGVAVQDPIARATIQAYEASGGLKVAVGNGNPGFNSPLSSPAALPPTGGETTRGSDWSSPTAIAQRVEEIASDCQVSSFRANLFSGRESLSLEGPRYTCEAIVCATISQFGGWFNIQVLNENGPWIVTDKASPKLCQEILFALPPQECLDLTSLANGVIVRNCDEFQPKPNFGEAGGSPNAAASSFSAQATASPAEIAQFAQQSRW